VHHIGPDYIGRSCETGGDLRLSAQGVAVGVRTPSDTAFYCAGQPWNSTNVLRTNAWHLLEIASAPGSTATISIDGTAVRSFDNLTMDRIYISAGFSDEPTSHAFWDEISILVPSRIVADTGALNPTPVYFEGKKWEKVDTEGAPPPPRYSHTAVRGTGEMGDLMYVFGGERSGYSYNDLWTFNLTSSVWSPVTLNSIDMPPARFDHSAVVMEHPASPGEMVMVIYGGRSGHVFLGDMWAFSFTSRTWTQLGASGEMAPGLRFGHGAAVATEGAMSGMMYLFGGYTENGFSNDFFMCNLTAGACMDISESCPGIEFATGVPRDLLPRYSHTMLAKGDLLFVYGGSDLRSAKGYTQVFKYASQACAWEKMVSSAEPTPVGRYEHAMAIIGDMLFVQGGHDDGTSEASTFAYQT